MARLIFVSVLLVGLVSSVHMQGGFMQQTPPMGQQPGGFLSNLLGGGNMNGMNGMNTNSNGGIAETIRQLPARGMQMLNNVFTGVRNMLPGLGRNNGNNNMPQTNNPLNALFPSNNNQMLPNNMNNMMPSNMNQLPNQMQNMIPNQMQNMMNGNGMNSNGLRVPNLNAITSPVTNALNQGRLPTVNEVTQGITKTVTDSVNGATSGLQSTMNNTPV